MPTAGGVDYGFLWEQGFRQDNAASQIAQFVWDGNRSANLIAVGMENQPTYHLSDKPFLFVGKSSDIVALIDAHEDARMSAPAGEKVRVFIRKHKESEAGLGAAVTSNIMGAGAAVGGIYSAAEQASEYVWGTHDTLTTAAGAVPDRVVEVAVLPGELAKNATYFNRVFRIEFSTAEVDFWNLGWALDVYFDEWKDHREPRKAKYLRQLQGGSEIPSKFEHMAVGYRGDKRTPSISWEKVCDATRMP